MRSPEAETEVQAAKEAVHARLHQLVRTALLFTHLVAVASLWGRWGDIALITVINVAVAASNRVLSHRSFLERTPAAENLRMAINVVGTSLYGHFADWLFPVWIFLPLNCLWVESAADLGTRVRLYGSLAVVAGCALLEGVAPQVPLTMFALCVIIASLSGARVQVLRIALERLSRRHDELKRALEELERVHRRAREQERLSSLGMLAAGIAHEVNNPMSYVKSNLCALQTDLQAVQKDLPPALREYVTEVLPETLEGVKRVCAIVADLRRFARGDPEALIEYDLNEEVRTALRITRGRMQAHCEVEVALETLPAMLGHPRQISQVVVNLLLNAAQAMKQRGVVHVATRQEGEDDVVLTVRDTGEGMAPEVLAQLFQPFFTTRSTGEGTGLGLAVAHGIVTAHGGRIRVESEPGQGTTFTLRLPRVPPLKYVTPRPVDEAPAPEVSDGALSGRPRFH